MSDEFVPQNDLERQLIGAPEGQKHPEEFIRTLLGSEICLPINETQQIGGLQTEAKTKPLKIADEDGGEVLVLFTSPERAKAFVQDYPGYSGWLPTSPGSWRSSALATASP